MPRRLPVYLVIDTSGSMSGEPIESVKDCLQNLILDLRNHPQALETAWISVITFDSDARQIVPLTDLLSFQIPSIGAGGMTALGPALSLLCERREQEYKKSWKDAEGRTHKADWRPLVFLMTDGKPNVGDLDSGIAKFKSERWGAAICCAAGKDADEDILKRITDEESVVKIADLSAGSLTAFFNWVTGTILDIVEKTVQGGEPSGQRNLSDMPAMPEQVVPTVAVV